MHMLQMVNLRKDPEGNNIFTTTNPSIPSIMGTESNQKLLDLTQRVKELESELERYQVCTHTHTVKEGGEGGREGGREGDLTHHYRCIRCTHINTHTQRE